MFLDPCLYLMFLWEEYSMRNHKSSFHLMFHWPFLSFLSYPRWNKNLSVSEKHWNPTKIIRNLVQSFPVENILSKVRRCFILVVKVKIVDMQFHLTAVLHRAMENSHNNNTVSMCAWCDMLFPTNGTTSLALLDLSISTCHKVIICLIKWSI